MGKAKITMSFCLREAAWSRGAVVPMHCSQDVAGVLWGQRKGRLRRKLVPFPSISSVPNNPASTVLINGVCLNYVSGEDSVARTLWEALSWWEYAGGREQSFRLTSATCFGVNFIKAARAKSQTLVISISRKAHLSSVLSFSWEGGQDNSLCGYLSSQTS